MSQKQDTFKTFTVWNYFTGDRDDGGLPIFVKDMEIPAPVARLLLRLNRWRRG